MLAVSLLHSDLFLQKPMTSVYFERLCEAFPPSPCDGEYNASVLIVLFPRSTDGKLSVLLTQRSHLLSTHAGEVAFPGENP